MDSSKPTVHEDYGLVQRPPELQPARNPVGKQAVLPVGKPLQSRFLNREHESGTHDFDDTASALHSKQTLCSNPAVSNMRTTCSLFTISHQSPRGNVPPTPQTPYDRFPYGLASSTDAYALGSKGCWHHPPSRLSSWEWQATFLLFPTNS